MWKFRSMHAGADQQSHRDHVARLIQSSGAMTKLDAVDDRLIRGARVFRAAGLDEMAQIINVIRGEMSLVGPRPCTLDELSYYGRRAKSRLRLMPGITGTWQVNGKNKTTFRQMIRLDSYYVRHMSPGLDLGILFMTVPTLARQIWAARHRRQPTDNET